MESYHNTNNEQGTLLFESNKKANSQEEKILKIFRTYPNKVFSAVQFALPVTLGTDAFDDFGIFT